jgi:hypothetical protein
VFINDFRASVWEELSELNTLIKPKNSSAAWPPIAKPVSVCLIYRPPPAVALFSASAAIVILSGVPAVLVPATTSWIVGVNTI